MSQKYENAVYYLKTSPMFNLSLSSNELFHSNFLYWIWKAYPEKFKIIINQLIGEEDYWDIKWKDKTVEVRREYKNFDLCIIDVTNKTSTDTESEIEEEIGYYSSDGLILFVLENKVKSIPYRQQLVKYSEKIVSHNTQVLKKQIKEEKRKNRWSKKWNKDLDNRKENTTTCKILLSLFQGFQNGEKMPDDWEMRSYANYLEIIENILPSSEFLSDYCEYVKWLINLVGEWDGPEVPWRSLFLSWRDENRCNKPINERKEEDKKRNYHITDAEELRLHALYHKHRNAQICQTIVMQFKNENVQNVQYIRAQDDNILLGLEPHKDSTYQTRESYFVNNNFIIGVYYNFTHGQPLVEIKVASKENSDVIYIIQVQDKYYEHGVIVKNAKDWWKNSRTKIVKGWLRTESSEVGNVWEEFTNGDIFTETALRPTNKDYNQYENRMLYQARELKSDVTTKKVIEYMVEDVKNLLQQLKKSK